MRSAPLILLLFTAQVACQAQSPLRATSVAVPSEPVPAIVPAIDPCAVHLAARGTFSQELEGRARASIDVACERRGAGAWRLAFATLTESPPPADMLEDDEHALSTIDGTWVLAYVDVEGRVAVGEPRPLHIADNQFYEVTRVSVHERFDLDGDGHEELLLGIGRAEYEAMGAHTIEVFTFRGGRVQPYGPTAGLTSIDEVRDVDGDGRPDLLSRHPYFVMTPFGVAGQWAGGPVHVYRSLADGSFSDRDPGALRVLREACPRPPARILPSHGSVEHLYDRGGLAVSCARIWGRSAEAVSAQVRAELDGACRDERHYTCAELADRLVAHAEHLTPPQTLTAP